MKAITEKAKLGVRFAADLLALRDDDVLLCSFPRSGNTWTRFMYCHLLMALRGRSADEVDFPFLDSTMPAIGAGNIGDEWDYAPYPRLVKTHARWLPFFRGKRSVGIVRDPRDVMVSYYHYQKDRNKLFDGSFSDFIRHPRYGLRRWVDHYRSWKSHWNIVVRFQDMKADTLNGFTEILRFLEIRHEERDILKAIQASEVERVRKADQARRKDTQENSVFARKQKRKWQRYFSNDDLEYLNSLVGDHPDASELMQNV